MEQPQLARVTERKETAVRVLSSHMQGGPLSILEVLPATEFASFDVDIEVRHLCLLHVMPLL